MEELINIILGRAAIVAAIAVFVYVLLEKAGFFYYVQLRGKRIFAAWAKCEFCISFWFAIIICMAGYIVEPDLLWLAVPVPVAVIGRFLI